MKKAIIIIICAVLVLVIGGGLYFWYLTQQPLYEPGMVREGKNLNAPLTPLQQSSEEGYWNVEPNVKLWHFSQGKGRPVLVVHGGPGYPTLKPWTGLEPLAKDFRFVYYDQRGCGKSTRPVDRFTSSNFYENMMTLDKTLGIGAQLADIERIRQILGEEKLILVGHSFGGFLASLYAAEFPEHVEALVLVSPASMLVMPIPGDDLFASVKNRLPADKQAEFETYMKDYLDFQNIFSKSDADLAALNNKFAKYYTLATGQESMTTAEDEAAAGGWMVWAMYMSMGTRHDYRPALKDVQAPVLVVHGMDDLQTKEVSHIYADVFSNSQFKVITKASHFSFEEQPDAFAQAVGDFLVAFKK